MALPKRTWGGRSGVRRISWRVDKISNFSQSVCPWINKKKKSQPIVMVSVTYSHKTYPFYHFPEISLSLSLSLPPSPSQRHWAKKAFNRCEYSCFFSIIDTITDNHHHQSERQGRHKMDGLPSGYRPNVGVCLINSDNLVCSSPLFSFIWFITYAD